MIQMRAIVIDHFGGPDRLVIQDVPEPEPKPGYVVIQEKAFGKSCPSGEFTVGSKVAALMGGLGRTINGSYAEFTRAPVTGVAPIESDLPWEELAVIPESYATAWTCLFRNLELTKGQTLVIRGAMSAFGQAALNMAVEAGAKVIGTTRNLDRSGKLEELGAHRVEVEGPDLEAHPEAKQIDAVLDLVGNSTILDSLRMLRRGGRACLAGWLGGLAPIADFNPLLHAGVSPVGRPAPGHRREGRRGPLQGEAIQSVPLRRDPGGAPSDGSQ
jgi:NADPH:quinone reductase-like Zn-dependent oxidoreductase